MHSTPELAHVAGEVPPFAVRAERAVRLHASALPVTPSSSRIAWLEAALPGDLEALRATAIAMGGPCWHGRFAWVFAERAWLRIAIRRRGDGPDLDHLADDRALLADITLRAARALHAAGLVDATIHRQPARIFGGSSGFSQGDPGRSPTMHFLLAADLAAAAVKLTAHRRLEVRHVLATST